MPDQTVTEGQLLDLDLRATDKDTPATELRFSVIAGRNAVQIDPMTGAVTVPTSGFAGEHRITVKVEDQAGGEDEISFMVDVNGDFEVSGPEDLIVAGGDPVSVTLMATLEGDPVQGVSCQLLAGAPPWLQINEQTGEISNSGPVQGGSYRVSCRGTLDQGPSDTGSFNLRVRAAPVIAGLVDLTVPERTPLAIEATATDADTPVVEQRFAKVAGPDWIAVDPLTGRVTGNKAGNAGTHELTVSVADPDGLSIRVSIEITVLATPVFGVIPFIVLNGGEPLSLPVIVTDPDSEEEAIRVELLTLSDWIVYNPFTGALVGDSSDRGGDFEVELRVRDDDGSEAVTTVLVHVVAAPRLAPPAPETLLVGTPLSVALSATDPDDDADSLAFSKVSGPNWITVSPDGRVSGETGGRLGVHLVELRVEDPAWSEHPGRCGLLWRRGRRADRHHARPGPRGDRRALPPPHPGRFPVLGQGDACKPRRHPRGRGADPRSARGPMTRSGTDRWPRAATPRSVPRTNRPVRRGHPRAPCRRAG